MGNRVEAEKAIIDLMNEMDKTGYNGIKVKEKMTKMSAKEFTQWMKRLNNEEEYLSIEYDFSPKGWHPDLQYLKRVAKKLKVPLTEYIAFPHANPDDLDNPTISTTKCPRLLLTIRKMRQMGSHENTASSNIDTVSLLTGQVTSDSKVARLTNVQRYGLEFDNMVAISEELTNSRADDEKAKMKLIKQIELYGDVSKKDIKTHKPAGSSNKQSVKTMQYYFLMCGYMIKV